MPLISLLSFENQNITKLDLLKRQSSACLANGEVMMKRFHKIGLVLACWGAEKLLHLWIWPMSRLSLDNSLLCPNPPQLMLSVPYPAKYPWNIGQSVSSHSSALCAVLSPLSFSVSPFLSSPLSLEILDLWQYYPCPQLKGSCWGDPACPLSVLGSVLWLWHSTDSCLNTFSSCLFFCFSCHLFF